MTETPHKKGRAIRLEVQCATTIIGRRRKLYVFFVGGTSQGVPWKMTVDAAVQAVESGSVELYVQTKGGPAHLRIETDALGLKNLVLPKRAGASLGALPCCTA